MIQLIIALLISLGQISSHEQWEELTLEQQESFKAGIVIEDTVAQ